VVKIVKFLKHQKCCGVSGCLCALHGFHKALLVSRAAQAGGPLARARVSGGISCNEATPA
jgi:hypothetical protein